LLQRFRKTIMPPHSLKKIISIALASLIVLAIPTSIVIHLSGLITGDLASYVNPFIGTEPAVANQHLGPGFDSGNVFPGAAFPHGMVQWSPDTTNAAGGYRYFQSTIHGFSLTHFSGRGCNAYQDIPFMPTTRPITTSPAQSSAYASTFSHRDEAASPGYYGVYLKRSNVYVALTATLRSGFGQFTYPPSITSTMLINAGGSATGNSDVGTGIEIVGNNQVVGSASSGHFCGKANTYTVYFAATFDHPFIAFGTWNGPRVTPSSYTSFGQHSGAYVTFNTLQSPVVQVKVGISFVSVANARANVQAENPGWDFDAVRQSARAAWNAHLGLIQVTGGTLAEKQVFYTALYHIFFHPNVFSDVNGQYMGFDQHVHIAQGYIQYENFPGWDMYRSLISLLALLEPRETSDMIQSLVADARQGGGGLPRWQVANDNSAGMVGDSPDVVIAMSYAFGARNFDTQGAWQAMNAGASLPGAQSGHYTIREGLSDYLHLGYVSTQEQPSASAAITLEYAIDDFAIAQYTRALGNMKAYAIYQQRAQNWQHLFNPITGYIEPRNPNGTFITNFKPTSGNGFVEGDSAQYTWLVPQDLDGLFAMMGGSDKAIERLNMHFRQLNAGPGSPYAFMGNEPEFEVPWEFDAAGAAYRTQEVVRRIETQLFSAGPGGLPGNDDGGALSSWYIFAALGLYPEIPGVAGFVLGSPLFPAVTVHLGNGHLLRIAGQAVNGTPDSVPYVQSLTLNGWSYGSPWIPFTALANGATLQFTLGNGPNLTWGHNINFTFASPPSSGSL
jgi:predicted alpha-1,2-mannosidase